MYDGMKSCRVTSSTASGWCVDVRRAEHLVEDSGVGLAAGEDVGDVGERDVDLFDVVLGQPDRVERAEHEAVLAGAGRPGDRPALEVIERFDAAAGGGDEGLGDAVARPDADDDRVEAGGVGQRAPGCRP